MAMKRAPIDMTEITWQAMKTGKIRLFSKELIVSPDYYRRRIKKSWSLVCDESGLTDTRSNKKIFAFHIRASSSANNFQTCPEPEIPFLITETGIHSYHES
jgi:hypothetical protein